MRKETVNQAIGTFAAEFGLTRDVLRRIITEARVRSVGKRSGHPVYRLKDVYNAVVKEQDVDTMNPHARLALARAVQGGAPCAKTGSSGRRPV